MLSSSAPSGSWSLSRPFLSCSRSSSSSPAPFVMRRAPSRWRSSQTNFSTAPSGDSIALVRRCAAALRGTPWSLRLRSALARPHLDLPSRWWRRTGRRFAGMLRVLAVLPIITPPFVIGLALILLFGRSGSVTALLADWFGIAPSRWIYGWPGILVAQLLAFAPIAFLVLVGVVQAISPSLEEAAQTLRAGRWRVFATVSFPLIRPGLANAFLLSFVESMADFGNPLVLGGNFDVLSTKIFFAVVGAAHDQSRAAVLSILLLGFTLAALVLQYAWLGQRAYTTVTGKGDGGLPLG